MLEDNPRNDAASGIDRRNLMRGLGIGAAGLSALGAFGAGMSKPALAGGVTDVDIFNFALNLEYLEAEFYLRATTGSGIPAQLLTGTGTQGSVSGGAQVPFKHKAVEGYAKAIADDELGHVMFIRQALGAAAVAEPSIDLTNSFNTLAVAAGLIQQGETFDPFADDVSFMLGAYVFEDVGVTAYAGAAPLLSNATNLGYAARILGAEGYHAGTIRGYLSLIHQGKATDAISAVRQQLSGVQDFGTDAQGTHYNISDVGTDGLTFARTAGEVLAIVYGGGTSSGLFYPNGVNGTINTAMPASQPTQ